MVNLRGDALKGPVKLLDPVRALAMRLPKIANAPPARLIYHILTQQWRQTVSADWDDLHGHDHISR